MKKITLLIIGMLLLTLSPLRPAIAAEPKSDNPIIQDCVELRPKFAVKEEGKPAFVETFRAEGTALSAGEKKKLMEEASGAFHRYVGCLFDGMVTGIIKIGVSNLPESFSAYTPSLPDLRSPEESCKVGPDMEKILLETSTDVVLPVVQTAYDSYYLYLKAILDRPEKGREENTAANADLTALSEKTDELHLYFADEMETTIAAIKTAFQSIKEMRQAYMLHLQFNCWINHLEGWRNMLEEIRKLVVRLPEKLIDASTTCPAP
jgi:hypothetical protein